MKRYLALLLFTLAAVAYGATTYTTNYNLAKPGDGDTNYGGLIRGNFDTIDAQLKLNADSGTDHVGDTTDAHDATAISTTAGTFLCTTTTTVQAYLDCLDGVFDPGVSGVVLITGNQSISGVKTFISNPVFSAATDGILRTDVNGTLQTTTFSAESPLTTKGDVLTHDGSESTRLAVGADGEFLKADSGEATGLIWSSSLSGITLSNVEISLDDDSSAFALALVSDSTLTGDKTLTFNVSDGNRDINLAGDLSLIGGLATTGSGNLSLALSGATSLTLPTTGTVVTEDGTATLTNKTLTGNTAANLVSGAGTFLFNTSGTITAPNATDTLVGKATTDIFTNKSISGATNTITNVSLTTGVTGTLPIANGGTGQTSASAAFDALSPMTTAGDLIYGGLAGTGTRLPAGTSTQLLHGGSTPSWAAVNVATDVTGVLPIANGGSNKALTLAAGGLLWTDADSFEVGAAGTASQWALSGGTGAPTFSNTTTTGKVIDIATDSVPLLIMGHSAQNDDLLRVESDGGANSLVVNGTNEASGANVAIRGTATNDNPADGFVGEHKFNNASGNTLATGVAETIATIQLTAGDWDVSGSALFASAGTTTSTDVQLGISKTPNTLPASSADGVPDSCEFRATFIYPSATNADRTVVLPMYRCTVGVGATEDLDLVATATFAVSTMTMQGAIWARRVR